MEADGSKQRTGAKVGLAPPELAGVGLRLRRSTERPFGELAEKNLDSAKGEVCGGRAC